MSLIKSISGIRGTIGGSVGENLTPIDTVKFAAAYGTWLKKAANKEQLKVAIGRDARISGDMVNKLVTATLQAIGIDVIDFGLSTTPTIELMVTEYQADGGIILTASHNPKEWNALKLLNEKGEFVSGPDGEAILEIVESGQFDFVDVDELGAYSQDDTAIEKHIEMILANDLVDVEAIKNAGFKVVIDAVNSTGGIAIPPLLDKLGVDYVKLYCEPNGQFPHNPEPLKEHLTDISAKVVGEKADLGLVVDPDVDRLAFIDETGEMFGEEYTLVAVADYVLSQVQSNTVSNLSSSRALRDVTEKHGQTYQPAAVGEVNVVEKMKETGAKIGGEGNGGIIFPALHYGRDALIGIALFLTHLAHKKVKVSELRAEYPSYFMSKNKIQLTPEIDVDDLLQKVEKYYDGEEVNTIDGVKVEFDKEWVHLRKSNTEPIIRVYTESTTQENADQLAEKMITTVRSLIV
ncbi:phosphoglucosamine mutase [Flavobacteriaceae bacterium Ap0902]|nr:phosphoglucosamine mutase [Flavobacteriaceae bacterium Ap0902]